jgi:hypothetical protein
MAMLECYEPSLVAWRVDKLKLDNASMVFVINTEGATDPARYCELVGAGPDAVLTRAASRISRVRS